MGYIEKFPKKMITQTHEREERNTSPGQKRIVPEIKPLSKALPYVHADGFLVLFRMFKASPSAC
jgi:hypothetical protein